MEVKPEVMGTPLYFKKFCDEIFPKERPLTIIEVGTWKGASAFEMIETCEKKCKMYCVDTWLGSIEHYDTIQRDENGYPTIFSDFWDNVKKAGYEEIITPITLPSAQAAKYLKEKGVQADVIYIDASHEYKDTLEDMEAYWELLKPGGVFIGDDYHPDWKGVMNAVRQFIFLKDLECAVFSKTWFIKK